MRIKYILFKKASISNHDIVLNDQPWRIIGAAANLEEWERKDLFSKEKIYKMPISELYEDFGTYITLQIISNAKSKAGFYAK